MFHIYTTRKDCGSMILQNDWYFNLYTRNGEFTEEDRAAIWKIDHANLTGDKRIETLRGTVAG